MIRRDEPVFHPVGLSDKGRVGSFTVNMAVIALPDAVTGERFHDLRAGIVLVQRRVVEEHDLFPIPGSAAARSMAQHRSPQMTHTSSSLSREKPRRIFSVYPSQRPEKTSIVFSGAPSARCRSPTAKSDIQFSPDE